MPLKRNFRQSSNVFHMLNKNQIVELRDAFNLFDQDNDGSLSLSDFSSFLSSIGSPYDQHEITEMLHLLSPNHNFMMFITYLGENLSKIKNTKEQIYKNFVDCKLIDDPLFQGDLVDEKWLKSILISENGITDDQYKTLIKDVKINDKINLKKLSCKIKHGEVLDE